MLIFNIVAFYVCWMACVIGAAQGYGWLGPVAVALFLAAQWRMGAVSAAHRRLLVVCMVLGFALDSALSAGGWYRFLTQPAEVWWAPPWMVALWANFGLALPVSMAWLQGRWWAAALLGGLGGPLSYLAGERLGAISLEEGALWLLAVVWAAVVPLLVWLLPAREGNS